MCPMRDGVYLVNLVVMLSFRGISYSLSHTYVLHFVISKNWLIAFKALYIFFSLAYMYLSNSMHSFYFSYFYWSVIELFSLFGLYIRYTIIIIPPIYIIWVLYYTFSEFFPMLWIKVFMYLFFLVFFKLSH